MAETTRKPRVPPPVKPLEPEAERSDTHADDHGGTPHDDNDLHEGDDPEAPPAPAGIAGIAAAVPNKAILRVAHDLAAAGRCCDRCQAGIFEDGKIMGSCHSEPPKHFIFITPRAVQVPGQSPVEYTPMSGWPVVRRDQFCIKGFTAKHADVQ